MSELNSKIVKATKWSSITEVVAKLITPITSIVLALLLTPEIRTLTFTDKCLRATTRSNIGLILTKD